MGYLIQVPSFFFFFQNSEFLFLAFFQLWPCCYFWVFGGAWRSNFCLIKSPILCQSTTETYFVKFAVYHFTRCINALDIHYTQQSCMSYVDMSYACIYVLLWAETLNFLKDRDYMRRVRLWVGDRSFRYIWMNFINFIVTEAMGYTLNIHHYAVRRNYLVAITSNTAIKNECLMKRCETRQP